MTEPHESSHPPVLDRAPGNRSTTSRLLGPDSLFQPDLSVVVSTFDGSQGVESAIGKVEDLLAERSLLGEVLVVGPEDGLDVDRLGALGATPIPPANSAPAVTDAGFDRARGDRVVFVEHPARYDVAEIGTLIDRLDAGADLVVGSRIHSDGAGSIPVAGYLEVAVLRMALSRNYRVGVTDPASGLLAFRRELLDEIGSHRWSRLPGLELIIGAAMSDRAIVETPVTYQSPSGRGATYRPLVAHLRFGAAHLPGDVFTVPGLVGLMLGGTLLIALGTGVPLSTGSHPLANRFRTAVLASVLAIGGTQLVGLGMHAFLRPDVRGRYGSSMTAWLAGRVTPTQLIAFGTVVMAAGVGYSGYLIWLWVELGFPGSPSRTADLVAITVLLLGAQFTLGGVLLGSSRGGTDGA